MDALQFTATEIHAPQEVEVVKAGSFVPGMSDASTSSPCQVALMNAQVDFTLVSNRRGDAW